MKNKINSRNLKISLLFTAAGIVASAFAAMYQLDMFSVEIKNQIILQLGSTEALIAIAAFQGGIITLISSFAGLMLAEKVNLRLNFRFDKESLMVAMIIGFLTAAVIVFSDRLIFVRYLPSEITNYEFSLLYLVTGILYGGIIEEILLRLFMISFFVFALWKLFSRGSDSNNIPGCTGKDISSQWHRRHRIWVSILEAWTGIFYVRSCVYTCFHKPDIGTIYFREVNATNENWTVCKRK